MSRLRLGMTNMQVRAPAKINLSLRILGRRPDGFHEIETFIAPISLFDPIEIEKRAGPIEFECDDPSVPAGEENLVVRAAKLFFRKTKQEGGVSIGLTKEHSSGGGVGWRKQRCSLNLARPQPTVRYEAAEGSPRPNGIGYWLGRAIFSL